MLDLSPEKLMMLLAVGLVVLGPNKLPVAARNLAHGMARARRLAASLTDPITTSLVEPVRSTLSEPIKSSLVEPLRSTVSEPRQAVDSAIAQLRTSIANHPLGASDGQAATDPSLN